MARPEQHIPVGMPRSQAIATGGLNVDAAIDLDVDLTAAGDGLNVEMTINSATAAAEGIDVAATQATTARTSGTVSAVKATTTSLAGDSGGTYNTFEAAAPTDGGGSATHNAMLVGAGYDALIDVSAAATGEADVVVGDNLASALQVRQAANAYLTVDTTDDAERVEVGKIMVWDQITTVSMNDATHTLVLGTAGAAETKLVGNVVFADPESGGASENLVLPAEASSTGMVLVICNTGGEGIVVQDDTPATVITLDTAQAGIVACDGTTWRGFMGAIT